MPCNTPGVKMNRVGEVWTMGLQWFALLSFTKALFLSEGVMLLIISATLLRNT